MTTISRRTLTQGVAWSVPAIAASQALPAFAVSKCSTPAATVHNNIKTYLDQYTQQLPDLTGIKLRTWFYDTGNQNGRLGEGGVMLQNVGQKLADFTARSMMFEFAAMHVDTSPAVNNTLKTVAGPVQTLKLKAPYGLPNNFNQPGPGDARLVGTCGPELPRRDISVGSSFVNFYSQDGAYRNTKATEYGEEKMECLSSTGNTAYGLLAGLDTTFKPTEKKNVMALHLRDSTYEDGRLYVAFGVRFLGFIPPAWEDIKQAYQRTETDEEFGFCYRDTYNTLIEQWIKEQGLRGATIESLGWSAAGWTSPDATGYAAKGGKKPVQLGEWIWSHEAGNFHGAMDPQGRIEIDGVAKDQGWRRTVKDQVKLTSLLDACNNVHWRDGVY